MGQADVGQHALVKAEKQVRAAERSRTRRMPDRATFRNEGAEVVVRAVRVVAVMIIKVLFLGLGLEIAVQHIEAGKPHVA